MLFIFSGALENRGRRGRRLTARRRLIRLVPAVVLPVAAPHFRDATAVGTGELTRLAWARDWQKGHRERERQRERERKREKVRIRWQTYI